MEIRGVVAELLWGYHRAAGVRRWHAVKGDTGWSLTGTLIDANIFRLSQRPLMFEVATAKGVWRWPVLALQQTGASFNAVLGPKEK